MEDKEIEDLKKEIDKLSTSLIERTNIDGDPMGIDFSDSYISKNKVIDIINKLKKYGR